MENVPEHLQIINERITDGLEVVMVWDPEISQAFSLVEDKKTGERFSSIAPDGVHPKETFDHPYIYRVGDVAKEVGMQIVRYSVTEADAEGMGNE